MLKEQLTALLQKEQLPEWIAFLRSLDKGGKKELTPVIKVMLSDNSQFIQIGVNTYGYKGKASHSDMLQLAAFVCMTRADYEKTPYTTWLINKENLDPVLEWYCPDWFSDFVNSHASSREIPENFSYTLLTEYAEKGWLHPTPSLLAKALYRIIYESQGRETYYRPDILLCRPITLHQHIWYLFHYETNIHTFERYIHKAHDIAPGESGWLIAFRRFIDSGHIDRHRLLRESLLASNNNFNKLASGWFAELFMGLAPTPEEILALQPELFNVLQSPHSKPVNSALDCLKKIIVHNSFNTAGFLEQAPFLLSSDAKSLVASVLQLLEKLAARHASLHADIVLLAMQVFIQPDEALQTKAARLIIKLQKTTDDTFSAALAPYLSHLKLEASQLLQPLIAPTNPVGRENTPLVSPVVSAPAALPSIDSTDDLIFLASQAFDNNQSWHIDVLPAALLKYRQQLQGNMANRLEAALQKALKIISPKHVFNSRLGFLDDLLAAFFADICLYLVQTNPGQTSSLQALFKKNGIDSTSYAGNGRLLAQRQNTPREQICQPHRDLLSLALQLFISGSSLPLLSTPTHEPGWIDPQALVQRLAAWQQSTHRPASIDLQIALSRCRLQNSQSAITNVQQTLAGENAHLLLFLLGEHPEPTPPFIDGSAWIAASLAKPGTKKYAVLEDLGYYNSSFDYYAGIYNWHLTENKELYPLSESSARHYALVPQFPSSTTAASDAPVNLLYDFIASRRYSFGNAVNDLRRLLLLVPNNPGPLLAHLLSNDLRYSTFYEVSDCDTISVSMQLVYDIWTVMDEPAHLFLATCMLSGDKTVKGVAGETWIKGTSQGHLNQLQTGRTLGLQLGGNYAPLKRFTDVMEQQLMGVSALHNHQLQLLTEHLLTALPDEPIKHLKKLLELYTELLEFNHAKPGDTDVQSKLATWRGTAALKKIIERCM